MNLIGKDKVSRLEISIELDYLGKNPKSHLLTCSSVWSIRGLVEADGTETLMLCANPIATSYTALAYTGTKF